MRRGTRSECGLGASTRLLQQDFLSDILNNMTISEGDNLFQDPPPREDCPICMLPMPYSTGLGGVYRAYASCCGKVLCCGCMVAADKEMDKGKIKELCSFCRVPLPKSGKEHLKRYKKRMKLNDAEAFFMVGGAYAREELGLQKDMSKALEMWNKSADLGSVSAYYSIGIAYNIGDGVEKNLCKSIHHWKLAAIGGHEQARQHLGMAEIDSGNIDRAMKHFLISARSGEENSLRAVGDGYKAGRVTKDEYARTLRAHKHTLDEIKSEQRDIAHEVFKQGRLSVN